MDTLRSVTPQNDAQTRGLPTLREVLALPSITHGQPRILAGQDAIDTTSIRWAHISELTDIAGLLRGGELVLTTGIGLPTDPQGLSNYVTSLAETGIGALVVELGRRFTQLPQPMVHAAHSRGLPLIVLDHETRFVEITHAVHTLIVDARVHQLERSELIHRRFTELAIAGASPESIVTAASDLAEQPVVLENLAHQVITFATAGRSPADLLEKWERRSRSADRTVATRAVPDEEQWTIVAVGVRGEDWGRLIGVSEPDSANGDTALVLERAATALALNRLSERDDTSVRVRAHQELLGQILEHSYPSLNSLHAKAEALRTPLRDRSLIGMVITFHQDRPAPGRSPQVAADEPLGRSHVEFVLEAAADQLALLVDDQSPSTIRSLASLPADGDAASALSRFAQMLHRSLRSTRPTTTVTIGVGSTVTDVRDARRSLAEASYVAAAAPASGRKKDYFELLDVRARGLIHALRHDPRLQTFVERELGPLVEFDDIHGREHVRTLAAYLSHGRNKSQAAAAIHVSRPSFYARLNAISTILAVDLDDPETCLSLHVAVLGLESLRTGAQQERLRPDLPQRQDR